MVIKYKKIIEEIMGKDAEERGYKIQRGARLLTRRELAVFTRRDNKGQNFYVNQSFLEENTVYLECNERISAHYTDEESFRKCISEFNDYMLNKGYGYLEEKLKEKYFTKEDGDYVRDNYEELVDKLEKNGTYLDKNNLKQSFEALFEKISCTFSKEWDDAIDEMFAVTAGLTYLLLGGKYPIQMSEHPKGYAYFLDRKEGLKFPISECPLHVVYVTYMAKDIELMLKPSIKRLLTEEEWKEIGL